MTTTYILRGVNPEGHISYYTIRRAGVSTVTPHIEDAFTFPTLAKARNRAKAMNRKVDIHYWWFMPLPISMGSIRVGDAVHAYTHGEERSVHGKVTAVNPGAYNGDYADITVDADGMPYVFGTGGHLGDTWTAESGMEQWFVEVSR